MKKCLFLILLFITTLVATAQKVQFKRGKDYGTVLLNDTAILSYKGIAMNSEYYFYKLNTTEEVIYIMYENNGTFSYKGDDYTKMFFSKNNVRIESKSIFFGGNSKPIIEKMIQEGVIGSTGDINEEKLRSFAAKYNDSILK